MNEARNRRIAALQALKADGLTIGECVSVLAVSNEDPYVKAARQLIEADDGIEIDSETITAMGDDGAWVMNWLWVSDDEAGVRRHADILETMLNAARRQLRNHPLGDAAMQKLRNDQADWLEDLITNYADELDGIETEVPKGKPGPIYWLDVAGNQVSFMPSDALSQLRLLARQSGLLDEDSDHIDQFCMKHGNKLDAILTVIQVPADL
jgi:hypothetical protein